MEDTFGKGCLGTFEGNVMVQNSLRTNRMYTQMHETHTHEHNTCTYLTTFCNILSCTLIWSCALAFIVDYSFGCRRGTLTAMTWLFPAHTPISSRSRRKNENMPRSSCYTRTRAAAALCYKL